MGRAWAALVVLGAGQARCPPYGMKPPYCSGHGDCDGFGRCVCYPGFAAGDCSERLCPVGAAWADVATADDTAHAEAECSNRGHCDRETGRCACASGFEGSACQRMTCQGAANDGLPLACSGNGECLSMYDHARFDYDSKSRRFAYEAPWDAHMVHGCVCGADYAGPACEERLCASGDDPLTSGQVNEVQLLSCVGDGDIVLRFAGLATRPFDGRATAAELERELEKIGRTIGDVVVTYTNRGDAIIPTRGVGTYLFEGGLPLGELDPRLASATFQERYGFPYEVNALRPLDPDCPCVTGTYTYDPQGMRRMEFAGCADVTGGGLGWCATEGCGTQNADVSTGWFADCPCAGYPSTVTTCDDVVYEAGRDRLCYLGTDGAELMNVALIEFRTRFGDVPPLAYDEDASRFEGNVNTRAVSTDGDAAYLRASSTEYAYAVESTKEYEPCAGRGTCGAVEGDCECFSSNFELYASSNLYGGPGLAGDCGYPLTDITMCPGAGDSECTDNGVCRGGCRDGNGDGLCGSALDLYDDDATPFPSPSAPDATWQAEKPYACACKATWRGGDCSEKLCPRGPSWFAYPSGDDAAHDGLLECSGMGACDRQTGECACPPHLSGAACERTQCPAADDGKTAPCNAVGRCMSMRELATHAEVNGEADAWVYGSYANSGLTWDADRVYGCLCDAGYGAFDCGDRECPTGDDPNTWGQANEVQYFSCTATEGSFTLEFREATTVPIPANATAADVEAALEALPTVGTATVAAVAGNLDRAGLEGGASVDDQGGRVCAAYDHDVFVEVQFETEHGDVPRLKANKARLVNSRRGAGAKVVVYADGSSYSFDGCPSGDCPTFASRAGDTKRRARTGAPATASRASAPASSASA
ncbi:hypothetical protein JL722_7769 [Aureococcus anophagefferens]|nr:hypothetical protein JL722_7769 [Aureococcus anophagefferens]